MAGVNLYLFEIATRKKYRFSYKGWISVEELWDMSLSELDDVFKWLNNLKKSLTSESLIKEDKENEDLNNKIEIVKYIFNVKKAEEDNRKHEAENAEKKRRILDILAKKQDEALENSSEEELKKMLDDLSK